MRIGRNPQKDSDALLEHRRHRVIVPVFIPHEIGFHANAFEVFRMSIGSLLATTGDETRITIVNNASIARVDEFCRQLVAQRRIDRYIVNAENRGKAEAVLAAARGSWEEFITVADADILFRSSWLPMVARAYAQFPRLGALGLLTSPTSVYRATSSVLLDLIVGGRVRIGRIVPDEVISEFIYSTGLAGSKIAREMLQTPQFYLNSPIGRFLLGANHAVITYRREIFFADIGFRVTHPFRYKSKLDRKHFDFPSDRLGYWRLSFPKPLAYHMGNHVDERALAIAAQQTDSLGSVEFPMRPARASRFRWVPYRLRAWLAFALLLLAFQLLRRALPDEPSLPAAGSDA